MEVVSFKLYQRKLIFDDLSAMFFKGQGRERVGLAASGGVCVGGGGGGGADRQKQRERVVFIIYFVFQLFCR